ncbi:SGNH/GDSL hydrolase family protein (plasmid) [Streptomyces sp. NBC_01558]|uniref:SGNH/GDSL hydrolase family protein n=1 Tax=Streptomyces sp. NBC_01558 TaxID=2975878 RepID=UPI002DDA5B48|nr:SGNH/GDSL hydrolase family protein [Streptomyces sp. NBC_01558]WSD82697.1 SGNH/GDSL hydrolase family protein [Streptomyces sp. NBC_01558]
MPGDTWIGNQCAIDHDHAAVVYAPRTFTNHPDMMLGGAFAAVVDLDKGAVTKLPFTASLAYFDPTCNPETHTAAFTAQRDDVSRVLTVDTQGRTVADATTQGQVTTPVPVSDGVVAALGNQLVHIDRKGTAKTLARTSRAPYDIHALPGRKIAFLDRADDTTTTAKTYTAGKVATIATGRRDQLSLKQGGASPVFLTGKPSRAPGLADSGVHRLNVPVDADVSSLGRLAVDPVISPAVQRGLANIKNEGRNFTKGGDSTPAEPGHALTVTGIATATGKPTDQIAAEPGTQTGGAKLSPALAGTPSAGAAVAATSIETDPVDTDRWCSIPRNDVSQQALQPTPNQVEWAVDMAVKGNLHSGYLTQGGWRSQTGISTVDPQSLFPIPTLIGGGRIPAQVELGILAQESNLWQAEGGSIPGQMGNPQAAIAGFYGHDGNATDAAVYWKIDWSKSDCGYGVGQVTDGMRLASHPRDEHDVPLSPDRQKAVALDYATNIAASLQILADKWNEVHTSGQLVTANNDDAAKPENWFTAIWNYNLGFNAPGKDTNWGLGWFNNPANPNYPQTRKAFMNTDLDALAVRDAAHPQDWPYEEKVLGWASWSMDSGHSYATSGRQDWPGESGFSSAGFRPAYWNGTNQPVTEINSAKYNRAHANPTLDTFCNAKNNCNAMSPPDCPDKDCYKQYWWHESKTTWKSDCATTCGFENIKYQTLINEPGRGTRLQYGTPVCQGSANDSPPVGSVVVDSVPDGTETWSSCGKSRSSGTFQFNFNATQGPGVSGPYEAKGDLHQVGGGYQGHYWYTHTRDPKHLGGSTGPMTIKGTWTLGQSLNWARVLVHLPDTGAQTRQAAYTVDGSDTTSKQRVVLQSAGGWVSIGAFHFTGTPKVSLSNTTGDGTGDEDVAWDAVAFQPLTGKPANSIVAMGDSYASGEGASAPGGTDFFPETDHMDTVNSEAIDKCHRSKLAWSRQATLPGYSTSIGSLADSLDKGMDYHFVACSGARTHNMLQDGQSHEVAQIDAGYLDGNTTLVTLSVGGNDARFTDVFKQCVYGTVLNLCQDTSIGNKDVDTGDDLPGDTGPLKDWAPKWLHTTVRPRITSVLTKIHELAPHAKIVLMGYPRLLSAGGGCPGAPGINVEEVLWLNSLTDTLDDEMKGAASDVSSQTGATVLFGDPRADFEGKAVCGSPEDVNGVVLNGRSQADNTGVGTIGMASFHPKIEGARLYANVLQGKLF